MRLEVGITAQPLLNSALDDDTPILLHIEVKAPLPTCTTEVRVRVQGERLFRRTIVS